ncbi:hypothetical protein SGGMMB4_04067 [Sodalis glossinidius str. 'morsitans']|uniref:Uncharacterized protein n=1 Tax=Sodalis glossinidius (strain morsitans) TaxID=343509 RepID=A0A193QL62_SODGM|nr:hypothetical protein SGGMMB4_04067 [Sodalis glossinidius str. 'morsitans']
MKVADRSARAAGVPPGALPVLNAALTTDAGCQEYRSLLSDKPIRLIMTDTSHVALQCITAPDVPPPAGHLFPCGKSGQLGFRFRRATGDGVAPGKFHRSGRGGA